MTDRCELSIAVLVLSAAGLVLAAPVLGGFGHVVAADAVMAIAAACGLGSFLLAGRSTLRAARSPSHSERKGVDRR